MEKQLTMDQLQKMIGETVASSVSSEIKGQLDGLRKETNTLIEKQLFDVQEGKNADGYRRTVLGSDLNTFGLAKCFGPSLQNKNLVSDHDFGTAVIANGGIFTKLSPAMERFAMLIKSGFNMQKASALGFDQKEYNSLIAAQSKAVSGASEGTQSDGGITVPVEYSAIVIEFAIQMSQILSKVWRVPMQSNVAKWPRLAQTDDSFFGGMNFTWLNEGTGIQTNPGQKVAWEQLTFTAHKIAANLVLTNELIQDSLINIVNYVTAVGTRAWMYEMEKMVLDGVGVYQPLGITNDPVVVANSVSRTTAGTVKYQDLINLEAAVNENFRNLEFILRRKTLSTLRTQVDDQHQPVYHENWGVFNENPTWQRTLIGYPFHVTRNARALGHAGDITLGDLSYYMLATRKDITIDMSPYPYWNTDETAIRFVARMDGKCGSPYAFKMLKGTGS